MLTKQEVSNQIVRVATKEPGQLGLFACSSIAVGAGMAGEFIDNEEGAVVPLSGMTEVVSDRQAQQELERWRAAKDKERIKEVVLNVDDAQKEFEGTIILHIAFEGSLAKTKAMTKAEKAIPSAYLARDGVDPSKIKGMKTLFESEEYDAIETFKQQRRAEFGNLGIPFPLGSSMYLIRIANIPRAEELAEKTERELRALVEALEGAYPSQITPEAVGLGPLYNPGDYRAPEAIGGLFKFKSKWMHFGVPEILKEIDADLWEKERERTAAVWKEAKEQGLILLRQTVAGMVARLVEAVTPNPDGTRKRFYGTAVSNLTDFFEVFEDRNLAGDEELAEQIEKLKALVSGKEIEAFKTEESLRQTVKTEGVKIQAALETMLVSRGARRITLED